MEALKQSREPGKRAKMDELIMQCIPRDVSYQTRVPPKFEFSTYMESQKRSDTRFKEAARTVGQKHERAKSCLDIKVC